MKDNQWRPEDSSPAHEENSSEDAESQGTQQFDEAAPGSFKPAAGPDATTAGFTPTAGAVPGAPAGEPRHVPSPLDSTQMAESPASGTRIADDPLAGKQPADDPLGSDPLTLDRKNASRPRSA